MADLCFICNKSLSEGDSVNVVRGLQTLKAASVERNDGHINLLNTLTSVNVHIGCRKVYISKNSIVASKRGLESKPSASNECIETNGIFDFKNLCLFCGQPADKAAETKKKEKYRRRISKVSTIEFKENVIRKADERSDSLGELVKDRINTLDECDLIGAEAKYHTNCFTKFCHISQPTNKPRQDYRVTQAMTEIFSYIESVNDSQFTLKELKDVLTGYVPDDKTIITRLQQKYSPDIIITRKVGLYTIISFRDTQSKPWYCKKRDPEEERSRIVKSAAAIIREDIQSSIVEAKSYLELSPSKMLDDNNEEIPKSLMLFVEEVIAKHRKRKIPNLEVKCTTISHAIMAAMRN